MDLVRTGVGVLCGLVAMAAMAAPTVYKCTKGDTVVFSPTPCGLEAVQVDTSRALRAGDAPHVQEVSDGAALARIASDCRMEKLAIGDRYQAQYRTVEQEIRGYEAEMQRSRNNFAGATRDTGLREQISGARQRLSDLQRAERQERAESARTCTEREREERQRQADKNEARAAAAREATPPAD